MKGSAKPSRGSAKPSGELPKPSGVSPAPHWGSAPARIRANKTHPHPHPHAHAYAYAEGAEEPVGAKLPEPPTEAPPPVLADVLTDLRSLLNARFPDSRTLIPKSDSDAAEPHGPKSKTLPTGIENWDASAGGLRLGEVTEVCGTLGGTGLLMDCLLAASKNAGWLGAWVDAGDALEVEDWDQDALRRMVWMRCKDPLMAMKGADLLLRDGNLSWVTLDLQAVAESALRRISGQHWHRFHRLVEHRGNALVVLTPAPMVEGAKVRVLSREFQTLDSLHQPRLELRAAAAFEVFVRGRQPGSTSKENTQPRSSLPLQRTA